MNIMKAENYVEMSVQAAEYIMKKIESKPNITLGLATGSTPKGLYAQLIKNYLRHEISFQHVSTINLDEYIGINPSDPNSYHFYMKTHLFDHIDILETQTHLPYGNAQDLAMECDRYDQLINRLGGIDLQILGIGQNGHIGFNEPGSSFNCRTHVVTLTDSTRKTNAKYFKSFDDVPTHAITMGIASILESREILLLASGRAKAKVIERLVKGQIDEAFPASALKLHKQVTIIADNDALGLLEK